MIKPEKSNVRRSKQWAQRTSRANLTSGGPNNGLGARPRAIEIIRSLIDRIEAHQGEKRGKSKVILVGALASIREYACVQTKTAASMVDGGRVLVVAGAGLVQGATLEIFVWI